MNLSVLTRPGDWLILFAASLIVVWLSATLWHGASAEKVVIRSGGTIVAEASLLQNQTLSIKGPLGNSLIAIQDHRVRVAADPSPRQYCVKQGWLARVGEAAICLPNQVSVEIIGARKLYDSLNY